MCFLVLIVKKVAILVPMYNEAGTIEELYQELETVRKKIRGYQLSYLFVDDGSTDETLARAEFLAKKDSRLTVVELSKNFGKEIALTAGIDMVKADAVIIMDADLQHPPAIIPEFLTEWEKGFEIVATRRTSVEGHSFARRFGSIAFYKLLNAVSDVDMRTQTTDFRLLDKTVVKVLQSFTERNRMMRGLIDWVGFRKTYIDFEAPARATGSPGYSFRKLISLAINSITSFSLLPLRIAGYMGVLITVVFGGLLLYMGVDKFFLGNIGGFTSIAFVIVVNSLLIGIVLMALGLIALYIGNIHVEVVNRPIYIVRKVIKKK